MPEKLLSICCKTCSIALSAVISTLISTSHIQAQTSVSYPQNLMPLESVHLGITPQSAWLLPKGQTKIGADLTWSNTFITEPDYRIDTEHRSAELKFSYGLSDDWEAGIKIPVVWRGGGKLDHFIRSWHDWFNLPEGQRESVRDNQFDIFGTKDDGDIFDWQREGSSLGNTAISLRHDIFSNQSEDNREGYASVLNLEVSLPTARAEFGHQRLDFGFALQNSLFIGSWQFHAGAGGFASTNREISGLEYHPIRCEGYLGADYGLTKSLRLGVNTLVGQQSVKNLRTFPDAFVYLDVGLFWNLSHQTTFKAVLRENPWPGDGTTDVGFIAGIEVLNLL